MLPLPEAIENPDEMPFVVPFPLCWYAKADAGRLLVSAAEEDPSSPYDAFADDMVIAEGLHRFSEDTNVEIRRVESSWAGLRTFSPDGFPVVGRDPRDERFLWFAGQGGFGIQTAPALAQLGASHVLGVEAGLPEIAASRVTGFRQKG